MLQVCYLKSKYLLRLQEQELSKPSKYKKITLKFNSYELRTLHTINIKCYTKFTKLTMRKN